MIKLFNELNMVNLLKGGDNMDFCYNKLNSQDQIIKISKLLDIELWEIQEYFFKEKVQ